MGFMTGDMPTMSICSRLVPVDRQYSYNDESGYGFVVRTAFHKERGWYAEVEFRVHGMATEEGAVDHLLPALKHFIRVAEADDGLEAQAEEQD